MPRVEDVCHVRRSPRRINWLTFALILLTLLALALLAQTLTSFKPRAEALASDQAELQDRLDRMDEELTEISQAVESWPGVITIITDESIPALADPETYATEGAVTAYSEPEWVTYKVTAYCPCAKCCGKWAGYPLPNGKYPEEGRTVAADLSILPRGTVIEIDGVGLRTVEDCGGAIEGYDLDLFFATHEEALAWVYPNGHKDLKVRVVQP